MLFTKSSHLIPSSKHGGHVPSENSLNGSVQSLVQSHPLPPRHSVTVSISSRAHLGSNCLFFQFSNQDSMFWKVLFHRWIHLNQSAVTVSAPGKWILKFWKWTIFDILHCTKVIWCLVDKYLSQTSSGDNCSIGLGSNGFPLQSSFPSLKSWTILLP